MKRAFVAVFVALSASISLAQQQASVGRDIYAKASGSVLLLTVVSATGDDVGLGSGFLVDRGKIVTNAHVADSGRVVIQVGPVRIPTKVEKQDSDNDLALLTIETELTLPSLTLAATDPSPGEQIFAIGNPKGLEKTISQGVVSAHRDVDGRKLLQISSPISQGSSGGPILNSSGEVVGVAVGLLKSGQNLNFAIPVSVLQSFLSAKPVLSTRDAPAILAEVELLRLAQKNDEFSVEPSSPWQAKQSRIIELLKEAFARGGDNFDLLLKLSDVARFVDPELCVKSAEKAIQLKATPRSQLALSQALTASVIWSDDDAKRPVLVRAEKLVRAAVSATKMPAHAMYSQLASVREDQNDATEAAKYYRLSLPLAKDADERETSLRGILRNSIDVAEVERTFAALQQTAQLSWYDWRTRAEWLEKRQRYKEAGAAYRTAAEGSRSYTDWCYGASDFWLANDNDLTLFAARQCIALGASKKDSERLLQFSHKFVASILNDRGVYSESLTHAKEAVALNGSDAWAYMYFADALLGLHRTQEAINAAKEAIRLSDGKWPTMHFTLGSAYFEAENFLLAKQSFEKAAELSPKNDVAAYNVAVCYARLGYYRDAANWYEEALRRNPTRSDRADLQDRIRLLRR